MRKFGAFFRAARYIAWSVCASVCLLAQGTMTVLYGAQIPTRRSTSGGQVLKLGLPNWFVIGITSCTAARKLVKRLKYAKVQLAVGILDQFVMKFRGPRQPLERWKTFAPTKSADS